MIAIITKMKREKNSANGNPRWRVFTIHGSYLTGTDSMIGHMISEDWVGRRVHLTLNHNMNITDIEEI